MIGIEKHIKPQIGIINNLLLPASVDLVNHVVEWLWEVQGKPESCSFLAPKLLEKGTYVTPQVLCT